MAAPTTHSTARPLQKVLVVDDHPLFRAGLVGLLGQEPDLTVCAEAGNAAQALEAAEQTAPDLALIDLGLPDRNGLDLLKDLRVQHPEMAVLIVSSHDETIYAERVLRAGGRGYIMKQHGPEKMLQAIRKVLDGKVYVSEETSAAILDGMSGVRSLETGVQMAKLTDREFEVLTLISKGIEAPEIARQLQLSLKTVDSHRMHIRAKLKLKNNTELVHYAARWGGGQA